MLFCTVLYTHNLGSKYPFSTGLHTVCTLLYTLQTQFKVSVLLRYTVHMLYFTVHLTISVQSIRFPQVYCLHAELYCTPHNLGSKYTFSTGILFTYCLHCTVHFTDSVYVSVLHRYTVCMMYCTVLYTLQSWFNFSVLHRYNVYMMY